MLAVLAMLAALARGGNPNVRGAAAAESYKSLVQELNSTNGDFHVDFTFHEFGNFTFAEPALIYADYMNGEVGSGCGTDNLKCSCTVSNDLRTLKMIGLGTDGTATGLVFGCGFKLVSTPTDVKQCYYYVRIPYSSSNSDRITCSDHKLFPTTLITPGGHDFTVDAIIDPPF
jgi:hypothetical protein